MILSYRARLIIANLIDAKLTELEKLNLADSVNADLIKIKEFKEKLLMNNTIEFSHSGNKAMGT